MRLTQLLKMVSKCRFRIVALCPPGPSEYSESTAKTATPHGPKVPYLRRKPCPSWSVRRGYTHASSLQTMGENPPTQPNSSKKQAGAGSTASKTHCNLFTRLSPSQDKHNQGKSGETAQADLRGIELYWMQG